MLSLQDQIEATKQTIGLLVSRKLEIAKELAQIDFTRPTAPGSGINFAQNPGGAGLDHVGYKRGLYEELRSIDKMILDNKQVLGDLEAGALHTFELQTRLYG